MTFPVDHLSASSLTTFMRCPRQWQDKYVFGNVGPSSEALLLGGYVHMMIEHVLKGDPMDAKNALDLCVIEQGGLENIEFKRLTLDAVEHLGLKMVYDYYERIGKYLDILHTEKEFELEVPGVPIPVVGRIDINTPYEISDIKTTGYFSTKQVRVNREWVFQGNVYQLVEHKPFTIHVITRAKSDSIIVPASINDPLYVPPPDPATTQLQILQVYHQIRDAWETWGDTVPWPGGVTHEWAGKYCSVENCCQR